MKTATVLSIDEQAALIEAICLGGRPFVILALETGIRLEELLALQWDDVDIDGGTMTVRHSKGGVPRRMTLSEVAMAALRTLPTGAPLAPQAETLRRALAAAAKAASLDGLRWHDLRSTAAIGRLRETQEREA